MGPFSKSDRLGKVSDWTGATYQDRRYMTKYQSQYGAGGTQYAYYHEEDETSFQLVDTARATKPMYGRGRGFRGRGQFRGRGNNNFNNRAATTTNLQTLTKAQKIKEMDFPRLGKLSLPTVNEPTDLLQCGALEYYDKIFDRIFHTVTTTDDPVIRKLVKTETTANVFATDAILATLMCASRSAYSWDIVVQKIGGKVFLDKRDNTEFDLLTVSETSAEPPQEEGANLNSPRNLALEATFVNHNFSQQVLKSDGEKYKFDIDNPFVDADEEGEVASVAYRYRRWNLGNDLVLICRCELDAVQVGSNNETQFVNLKALNEWDSRHSGGVDWRQKLDTQRGAVLANELKNNACKLAKWTVQSILAEAC